MKSLTHDQAFMSELRAASTARPPVATTLFLAAIALLVVVSCAWATIARID